MENISHTVVGLAIGELIDRSLPEETTHERAVTRRTLILWVTTIASNFPDLDLILTPLLSEPLGYLLHHRGHTHTLLYAIPQAFLLFGLLFLFSQKLRTTFITNALARKGTALGLTLGFSLHFLMDYLNSYGIHPFHPFDSSWYFGDMVFIVEPFFWVIFGIPMTVLVRKKWLRRSLIAFLMGVPGLFTYFGFLSLYSLAILLVLAVLLFVLQVGAGPRGTRALIFSAMCAVVFVGLQSFSSGYAKKAITAEYTRLDGSYRLIDAAMSSYPTNPVCWTFVSFEANAKTNAYRLRRGAMSILPAFIPAPACPRSLFMGQSPIYESDKLTIVAEDTGELEAMRKLRAENCHFEAWLRFARMPHLIEGKAFDFRFSRGPQENFTTIDLTATKGRECEEWIPQWDFPREDLFGKASR